MTPQTVLAMCRERDIKAIDMRFMDFPGIWQHFTIPVSKLDEEVFEDGLGFDGSSIRGWQAINESDMLLLPQPDTAFVDPFTEIPTLCMICNVQDPITREDYTRDPRNVARKAVNYLKSTGVADTCFIGPEAEFFIFDDVRFDQTPNSGYFYIDSEEGQWNRGKDYSRSGKTNLGYKLRHKEGYFPVPPADALMDIRNEMMLTMIECGTRRRSPAPRSGHRRPERNRPAVRRAGEDGRQHVLVQVHHQERRQEVQQDRHVHAQAAVQRQRLRHAHAHLAVEGRQAAVRRQRLRGPERDGPVRHRRPAEARPGDPGLHQPDDQQLQAAGAGLRSAGEPGVLAAEPLGLVPHSDVQPEPEGQARRVPLPRPELQSVPGVRHGA